MSGLSPKQKKGLLKYRRSIYKLPPYDEVRYSKIVEETFENNDFIRQLNEVKTKLEYDDLIEDVIKFHIREMSKEVTKVRPWKRRIFINAWAYIEVFPHCFNPYSVYYKHTETMKLLKKFKKQIETILKITKNE